jgi:antitoxin VapB
MGITPLVVLVGADERIERFRHPVATDRPWRQRLLVVLSAERGGQVVALSRMVANGSSEDLANRMRAVTSVFTALLDRTREGATGAELYLAAASAYASAGFPGEELRHHQGGAIGYRSREWVAHPRSGERVAPPQAFAWNPTVAGAKVEDTCVVAADGHVEVVTATPDWPVTEIAVRDQRIRIADALVLDA